MLERTKHRSIRSARFTLPDPGFVPNTADKMHCFQATLLMAMRARPHSSIPSIEELDNSIGTTQGKYSWPYAGLTLLNNMGFDVILWEAFDPAALVAGGEQYILDFFGEEVGTDQIANSDLPKLISDARKSLSSKSIQMRHSVPEFEDLQRLIKDGYYLNIGVNQRILQGDTGYVGHGIFAFGCSDDSVIVHNPGPPAQAYSEISQYLLDRAWSYPDRRARTVYAFRPRSD